MKIFKGLAFGIIIILLNVVAVLSIETLGTFK